LTRRTTDGRGAATSALSGAGRLGLVAGLLAALLCAAPAWCRTRTEAGRGPLLRRLLLVHHGEHVTVLSLSSVEWGAPDRWSFTSRAGYLFGSESARDGARWIHAIALTASPGISGGRLGLGYQFVPSLGRHSDVSLLGEVRAVAMRTWGHPLVVGAGRTFAGVELRASLVGFLNAGVGWFGQIGGVTSGERDHFWGCHFGVGV
jgi:hypothetical protein